MSGNGPVDEALAALSTLIASQSNRSTSSPLDDANVMFAQRALQLGTSVHRTAFYFNVVFAILGVLAVVINSVIVGVILAHWKRTTKQVFYLLVLNFAFIDIFRGACLILWSVRILKPETEQVTIRLILIKMDQIALVVLRFCTLCTILNLLMITLNEYIFIQFPLRYQRIVNRTRTIIAVVVSWLISIAFVLLATYVRNYASKIQTVFVRSDNGMNGTYPMFPVFNYSADPSSNISVPIYIPIGRRPYMRPSGGEIAMQHIFNFTLLGICFLCLIVVLFCYFRFLIIVRRIQRQEESQSAPLRQRRRSSELSLRLGEITSVDDRRVKTQMLRRYKYAVVIGLVIVVYLLYLASYASVQLLQFFNLRSRKRLGGVDFIKHMETNLYIRMAMHLLFGLHSILQPLCYFRMKEFRILLLKSLCGCLHNADRTQYSYADSIPVTNAQTTSYVHAADMGSGRRQHRLTPALVNWPIQNSRPSKGGADRGIEYMNQYDSNTYSAISCQNGLLDKDLCSQGSRPSHKKDVKFTASTKRPKDLIYAETQSTFQIPTPISPGRTPSVCDPTAVLNLFYDEGTIL